MRVCAKHGLWFVLLCGVLQGRFAAAQRVANSSPTRHTARKAVRQVEPVAPGMLTADDGLDILGAALQARTRVDSESDCSHLVHGIYERAGFSYRYASSSELYVGVKEFRLVIHPQPGDLAVWPGHVGIVINPAQRSFYSALRSGLGVDFYDARYWRERGHPRFYRYVKGEAAGSHAASAGGAGLKPSALARTEPPEPISGRAGDSSSEKIGSEAELPAARGRAEATAVAIPRTSLVSSTRPNADQVQEALLGTFSASGEALREEDVFRLPQPVIVFDGFVVEQVRLQGDRGWAKVRISEPSSVRGGRANLKKRSEKQRWMLRRRDGESWEVMLPAEAIYLPKDVAVRVLAHQLAALAGAAAGAGNGAQEKADLAQLLNELLKK